MLVDILGITAVAFVLAKLLNKVAFAKKPAPPRIAWALTAMVYIGSVGAIFLSQAIVGKSMAAQVGVASLGNPKPNLWLPIFIAWLFYSTLARRQSQAASTTEPDHASGQEPRAEAPVPMAGTSSQNELKSLRTTFVVPPRAMITFGLALTAAVAIGWAFRYETIPTQAAVAFYKVNRWTGTTHLCNPSSCREVQHAEPSTTPKIGQVVDGYRFLGGDPSKETSWEKVEAAPR